MATLKDWPKGYQDRVEKILGAKIAADGSFFIEFPYESKDEARSVIKQLLQIKQLLRQVKKDAEADMAQVRAGFTAKKVNVSESIYARFSGKKAARDDRQKQREKLKDQQRKSLVSYQNVQKTVDRLLSEVDRVKLQVEEYISTGTKASKE